jgi:hypothetical protein
MKIIIKYYILASYFTVLFNVYCRLCFRLRAALLCWFSLFHYMFRSYDHHQAEKYITTLGLLN